MAAIAVNLAQSSDYRSSEEARAGRSASFGAEADEPVIDLVHLARQTFSDQALELELLDMFERQSARIVSQLAEADARDVQARCDLAHKLKGSALAIGAGRVARSAQVYEASCATARGGSAPALDALTDAVAEARTAIARLLG